MTKKLIALLTALLLCACMFVCVSAAPAATDDLLLIDEADLLSASEESSLRTKLAEISAAYGAQVCILTIGSSKNADTDAVISARFDDDGYGYGDNRDGVLLLVCMDPREYRILSNGFASEAITMDNIDSIGDNIVSYLSDGDYAEAFEAYAEECDYYLNGYINGFPFAFGTNLLIAVVFGLVVGFIVASVLKGQLKSVRKQDKANVYVKAGSFNLTRSNDFFLYRTVTRTEKPKNTSSGSSGSRGSRNIGGGKF